MSPATRARSLSRYAWATALLGAAAVMVIATWLHPDPAGHGTHTQLGLPPCGFFLGTGLPCPGCGLTTCFAHMVRFEIGPALEANAFGVPLFLTTAAAIPLSLWGLQKNAPVVDTLIDLHAEKWFMALSIFAVVVWVARIAF